MLLKDIKDCSTASVRGLDNQLIAQMNKIRSGLLVRIDDLDVTLGAAVHPWLQAPAKQALKRAIAKRVPEERIAHRGRRMIINSAYRTIAGQWLLRNHHLNGRCGITAAAPPGKSNHNNASSIDIEDSQGWRTALRSNGWAWLGAFDPMHYDAVVKGIAPINSIAVQAFQQLWNIAHPNDKLAVDGDFGAATESRLRYSPAEGFPGLDPPRILKLTEPLQVGADVGEIQLALRAAGITLEVADKVFGSATDKAVKQFQVSRNLTADGVLGDRTLKLLMSEFDDTPPSIRIDP
jgi:hypothetical protein